MRKVPPELEGARLDIVLRELYGMSRREARRLITGGAVFLDDKRIRVQSRAVEASTSVRVGALPKLSTELPDEISVLYEDEGVLFVDKPSGVPTSPTRAAAAGSLTELLRGQGHSAEPVHRLDTPTSGALLLAKSSARAAQLSLWFQERRARRVYLALTSAAAFTSEFLDVPLAKDPRGLARVDPAGKPSQTCFTVLVRGEDSALLLVEPITGRAHQIRAHLAHLGAPILGDHQYGARAAETFGLHASALCLEDYAVQAPVSEAFAQLAVANGIQAAALQSAERAAAREASR